MVTEFQINDHDTIVCSRSNTRNGFRHIAEYRRDGKVLESRSVSYLNRTWESFEYESAIAQLLKKMRMEPSEATTIMAVCKKISYGDTEARFGSIAAIAAIGDIMGSNQKEKNDWKARMIKAGLGSGIEMPEDWETLSEDEKERRLTNVIGAMRR